MTVAEVALGAFFVLSSQVSVAVAAVTRAVPVIRVLRDFTTILTVRNATVILLE